MAPSRHEEPVDLAALRAAAAPLIAWYEQLLAGRPMPVVDLDRALAGIRALPPVGGRLGRALSVVATGGWQDTTDETVSALELLRCSAGLRRPPHAPIPPAQRTNAARHRRPGGTQLRLPGLDDR